MFLDSWLQTPVKQMLQVSSLTSVQVEKTRVDWLLTKLSRKKMPERTQIRPKQQILIAICLKSFF